VLSYLRVFRLYHPAPSSTASAEIASPPGFEAAEYALPAGRSSPEFASPAVPAFAESLPTPYPRVRRDCTCPAHVR